MVQVLLADDCDEIREGMSGVLKTHGYDVVTANNGRQALVEVRNHKPDIAVVDIFMPERDGLEVINDIRSLSPETKIVAITGYDGGSFRALVFARAFGVDRTLRKPFSVDELIMTLGELGTASVLQ